jgi:hypothetical protein
LGSIEKEKKKLEIQWLIAGFGINVCFMLLKVRCHLNCQSIVVVVMFVTSEVFLAVDVLNHLCSRDLSAVIIMICYLKETARQQGERERIESEREKKKLSKETEKKVCGYPTKNYNKRTSKMSFFSTTHTRTHIYITKDFPFFFFQHLHQQREHCSYFFFFLFHQLWLLFLILMYYY